MGFSRPRLRGSGQSSRLFLSDVPAGTGNTYCLNTLLAGDQGNGMIAIVVATCGNAAILLCGIEPSTAGSGLKLREGAAFSVRREDGLAMPCGA